MSHFNLNFLKKIQVIINYIPTFKNNFTLEPLTAEFNFTTSNFVQEKFGKINKDYTLLNPPLGKGKNN